jgi:hypothetical protein
VAHRVRAPGSLDKRPGNLDHERDLDLAVHVPKAADHSIAASLGKACNRKSMMVAHRNDLKEAKV